MIKSMTGFGKAECVLPSGKYLIEIRSLNGKNCDITLKTSLIPRDKEMELRQMITDRLNRGTVDIFITAENNTAAGAKVLNKNILLSYYRQVQEAKQGNEMADLDDSSLLETLLRMPDIFVNDDQELTDDMWDALKASFNAALDHLDEFRATEGKRLYDDVLTRVTNIESYVGEVDKYEHERVDTVRKKLEDGIAELKADPDKNRLEQEIVFYVEKLDINEEKVRLRQHCKYFLETLDTELYPGRKLGFISQEMGREINTLGSKANHAEIQKIVVKMKDELDKTKEQSANIL
jgi:TIGR00255 family protein